MPAIRGYAGYSYRWEGDDALWSSASRRSGEHILPAQGECIQCHTEAAGGVLGLELNQLGDFSYEAGVYDQVDTLQYIGVLPADLQEVEPLDGSARAWLHANCSGCHRPDGSNVELDLRFEAEIDWCAPPTLGMGDTLRAALLARVGTRNAGQMPPLATDQVDLEGLELLQAELPSCPDPEDSG